MRHQGSIGGHHDNDGAGVILANRIILNLLSHGNSRNAKLAAAAAIALHPYAKRVASRFCIQLARSCTDAAFEAETDHAGAAANAAFGHWSRGRAVERLERV